MVNVIHLDARPTQAEFGALVGVSQQSVSAFMADGVLPTGGTWGELLSAYCKRLREVAAGRLGDSLGSLDLVQERAGLARAQRESQELKNAVARGEYAPIGVLADVLGMAASAVVDRMDQFEGLLSKTCPDLPEEARTIVLSVMASARNEWIRSTVKLVEDRLDAMQEEADDRGDEWCAEPGDTQEERRA